MSKTNPPSDYLGKTNLEGEARKSRNLFTMNDHKFTKIGKMLYQRNSYIGYIYKRWTPFLVFIFQYIFLVSVIPNQL